MAKYSFRDKYSDEYLGASPVTDKQCVVGDVIRLRDNAYSYDAPIARYRVKGFETEFSYGEETTVVLLEKI
jgi:hypothetical protein